jgi:hypothetical protein
MLTNSKMIPKRIMDFNPGLYMVGNGSIVNPLVFGFQSQSLDSKIQGLYLRRREIK